VFAAFGVVFISFREQAKALPEFSAIEIVFRKYPVVEAKNKRISYSTSYKITWWQ